MPPIYVGANALEKRYIGATEVTKIYRGLQEIFSAASGPVPAYSFDFSAKTINGAPITDEISFQRSTIAPLFTAAGYEEVAINTPAYADGGLLIDGARTFAGYGNTDLSNATYWLQTGVTVSSAGTALGVDWYDVTETAGTAAHNLSATANGTSSTSSALWWSVALVDVNNTTGRYIQISNRGSGAVFDLQTGEKTDCALTAAGGITAAVGSYIKEVASGIYLIGICVNKTNGNKTIIRLSIVDSLAVIDAAGGATTNGSERKMRVALPTGCYSARKLPYPLKMPTANIAVAEDIVKLSAAVVTNIGQTCTLSMSYVVPNYYGISSDTQVIFNKNAQANPVAHINTQQCFSFNEGAVSILPKAIISRNEGRTVVYGWDEVSGNVIYGHGGVTAAMAAATVVGTTEIRLGGASGLSSLFGVVTRLNVYQSLLTVDQANSVSGYSANHTPMAGRMSGVNMAGMEFNGGPFYPDQSLYNYFADAGCKVVRIPFKWETIQPTINGALDTAFLANLVLQVGYATLAGMQAVIDVHNYAKRDIGGTTYVIGSAELPVSAFADLWTRLSAVFKTDSSVIFGLMNEPTGITSAEWFPAAQAAIDAIRATGSNNQVFVPGINFTSANAWLSQSATGALTITDSGNNFVFEVHSYMDSDGSGTSPTNVTAGAWGRIREFTDWCRTNGKRGFLGEFATIDTDAGGFEIDAIGKYIKDNGDVWLGWTWWASGAAWASDYYYLVTPTGTEGAYVDRPLFGRIKPWLL